LATLGAYLRFGDHGAAELVSEQELESLFRQSLDLDPHRWRSYERAGTFFNFRGELGEAERCFARAFRLVRNESSVALPLAEIYSRTDRHRDAIAVLDLCLREGSEDPNVPYRAAILAHQLKRFDATLSYLGRFTSEMPATPWIYYYRASSLLESQRYDETLQTIAQQEKEFPEFATVILIMRASALGGLKDLDGLHKALDAIMQLSLRDVDYLSIAGLAQVTRRLWLESECLPDDDLRKVQLCDLLLASGLAPNELFRPQRLAREKQTGLVYAECHVRQPLNRLWSQSSACLHGQENWTAYDITWGVLAQNQETAEQWVLDWQSRCYGVPGEVREVKVLDSGFTDHPGVVWQGAREGVSPEMGG